MAPYNCSAGVFAPLVLIAPPPAFISGMARSPTRIFEWPGDEGVATGTFVYDFAHHETRLSNVVSGLRPTEAIYWIDPKLLKVVTPTNFKNPYDYHQRCLSISRR